MQEQYAVFLFWVFPEMQKIEQKQKRKKCGNILGKERQRKTNRWCLKLTDKVVSIRSGFVIVLFNIHTDHIIVYGFAF